MFAQSDGGGEDDEVGDQVRKSHADEGVGLDPAELGRRFHRPFAQRMGIVVGADFFDFLRRLPEEQVGRNRGAEDGHDQRHRIAGEGKVRPHRALEDLEPWQLDGEHRGDVRQQAERQPFQVAHVGGVRQKYLQRQAQHPEAERVQMRRADPGHQARRFAHRGDVGGDVDDVGQQQQDDDGVQQPRRIGAPDVGGQPAPGDPADARRHQLDADHERVRQHQRPQGVEAELGAGLGIRRDARRVVVGGAGDQARAERFEGGVFLEAADEWHGWLAQMLRGHPEESVRRQCCW